MEHEIPFGNSNRENGTTFLDFPLFLGIFQWDEPTKRVPFTSEPEIPEILSKWKAPFYSVLSRENSTVAIQYSALFALGQSRMDLKMSRTIDLNMRTSQELDFRLSTTSKNNLPVSEFHIFWPTL